MDSPPQSEYKIILLGDLGAGKTSFFLRVKCKQFIDTATDSVHLACDEFVFNYAVDGTSIKIKLCDTAGSERFRTLTDNYYRNANAAILCYSLTDSTSLTNLYQCYKMAVAAQYKIVLIGNAGVGKSSFFQRLRLGQNFDLVKMDAVTLGLDCFDYMCTVGNASVKVALYDTASNEKYRSTMTSNYFRHARGVILMYSVDDQASLVELSEWKATASLYSDQDITWALIGNKCDLFMEVPEDAIKAKCDEFKTNLSFMVSAKTGENVKETFEQIVDRIHNRSQTCHKPGSGPTANVTKVVSTKAKRGSLC
eukprot:Em0018g698a